MNELMVMLPAFYIMNQIDWTQPENVLYVRIGYTVATLLSLSILGYVYTRITATNNKAKVKVPPAPYSGGAETECTVTEYDIQQLKKAATQILTSIAIISFIHFQWAIIQPLFIQCVMGPMQVFKNPLVKIFLLGQKGDIEHRPFKEESPFASLMPQAPADTTKNADTNEDNNDNDEVYTDEDEDDNAPRVKEITEEDEKKMQEKKKKNKNKNKKRNKSKKRKIIKNKK